MIRVTWPIVGRRRFAGMLSAVVAVAVLTILSPPSHSQQPAGGSDRVGGQNGADQQGSARAAISPERISELEKTLSGAALAGHFTIEGRNESNPREERYELGDVKHLDGDTWMVSARIKYGNNDVTLPLMLPIHWSDDKTAVITVEEMSFPGLGTYSARVMIYGDHYAGYWTASDHGGHLFGKLEHPKAEEKKDAGSAPAAK